MRKLRARQIRQVFITLASNGLRRLSRSPSPWCHILSRTQPLPLYPIVLRARSRTLTHRLTRSTRRHRFLFHRISRNPTSQTLPSLAHTRRCIRAFHRHRRLVYLEYLLSKNHCPIRHLSTRRLDLPSKIMLYSTKRRRMHGYSRSRKSMKSSRRCLRKSRSTTNA